MAKKSKRARRSGAVEVHCNPSSVDLIRKTESTLVTKLVQFSSSKDRLSSLPDEILINNILPLLPTREAQRTSILARSWRYLWLYVPGLDLDGSQKVVRLHTNHPVKNGPLYKLHLEETSKYAEWVDRVIDAYRGTTPLRHFRVLFRLDKSLAHKIDSWLAFSLRQGVEVLELDCCFTRMEAVMLDLHTRSSTFVGGLQYRFLSVEPSQFPNIRLLRSLTLKAVRITSGSLEQLLLACGESLEKLQLARVSDLTWVNVTGPVSRLKHIHIDCCNHLGSITVHAPTPDLVSFSYPANSKEITLHIEHAPRLVDLRMVLPSRASQRITLHSLFRYLSQLEALHLVHSSSHDMNIDPWHDFPVLSRLKHLKLDFDGSAKPYGFIRQKLRCLASLIEIAPPLQHLTLEVRGDGMPPKLLKELANTRLQLPVWVIEIAGFRGRKVDCKLALHLINAAPSLEKIILDDPARMHARPIYILGEDSRELGKICQGANRARGTIQGKAGSYLITSAVN